MAAKMLLVIYMVCMCTYEQGPVKGVKGYVCVLSHSCDARTHRLDTHTHGTDLAILPSSHGSAEKAS